MAALFELWRENDGTLTFFDPENDRERQLLETDAQLIWTVLAETWEQAMTARNEYLGFEPYRPLDSSNDT